MRIQLRRGTAAAWAAANPVLAQGEPGEDTTNNILRIGDGVTAWLSLPQYSSAVGGYSAFAPMTNYDAAAASGVPTLQARTEPGGITRVEGNVVFSGIIVSPAPMFTLPAGMAPEAIRTFTARTRVAGVAAVFITFNINGTVVCSANTLATQIIDFDGMTFRHA